jgi:hypothetical protein
MSKSKVQNGSDKVSKKQLRKLVFEKLTGSLSEYHLKGKKLENRLDKVSRLLAGDIVKVIKKEHQQHEDGAAPTKEQTPQKKKAKKEKQVAVAQ